MPIQTAGVHNGEYRTSVLFRPFGNKFESWLLVCSQETVPLRCLW